MIRYARVALTKGGKKLIKTSASASCEKYDLDKEWFDLILQAKQIRLSVSEVRHFLNYSGPNNHTVTANPKQD